MAFAPCPNLVQVSFWCSTPLSAPPHSRVSATDGTLKFCSIAPTSPSCWLPPRSIFELMKKPLNVWQPIVRHRLPTSKDWHFPKKSTLPSSLNALPSLGKVLHKYSMSVCDALPIRVARPRSRSRSLVARCSKLFIALSEGIRWLAVLSSVKLSVNQCILRAFADRTQLGVLSSA